MATSESALSPLERSSPTLFLIGGALVVVFAGAEWAGLVTGGSYVDVRSVFGQLGFALGFLGLAGLTPAVKTDSPKLSRVGAVFALLGAVGFATGLVAALGEIAGVLPAQPAWAPAYIVLIFSGALVGYPAIAAAILRTTVYSRKLGVLLLAPAVLFVAVLGLNVLSPPDWVAPMVGSGHALALLAIGYTVRTESASSERARSPADSPV